ncbi:MAG TPA: DUF6263 family protein [Verrucomicrobiae bacterium]|jgi:hypothetical protein|nr:DUF6263 family protein [Verrucomicrobiae bacterium]
MKKLFVMVSAGAGLSLALSGCSKQIAANEAAAPVTNAPVASVNPVLPVPAAPVVPVGPVELKVKWAVGKKYLFHRMIGQDSQMSVSGQPVEQVMTMDTDYSLSAQKALADGGCDLGMEFLSQKFDSSLAGKKTVSFDSAADAANDAQNPEASMLRKIIGKGVQFETDTNGRVQQVVGTDELIDAVGANSPHGMMIKAIYNDDTLKQYAEFSRGLPDHAVQAGDTWPMKLDMPMDRLGIISLDLTYTFKGWDQHNDRQCVQLIFAGSVTSKADTNTGDLAFTIQNGKMSGTTWFDPAAGAVIEATSEQTMDMTISPATNEFINSATSQKTDVKLVDVTDIK